MLVAHIDRESPECLTQMFACFDKCLERYLASSSVLASPQASTLASPQASTLASTQASSLISPQTSGLALSQESALVSQASALMSTSAFFNSGNDLEATQRRHQQRKEAVLVQIGVRRCLCELYFEAHKARESLACINAGMKLKDENAFGEFRRSSRCCLAVSLPFIIVCNSLAQITI